MEYKFVELLSCHFLASGEDIVRQQITFRYNSVKVPEPSGLQASETR